MDNEEKNLLDYEGLTSYDDKIKRYINNAIETLKEEITDLTTKDVDDILEILEDDEEETTP